jgi:hypothetical protein
MNIGTGKHTKVEKECWNTGLRNTVHIELKLMRKRGFNYDDQWKGSPIWAHQRFIHESMFVHHVWHADILYAFFLKCMESAVQYVKWLSNILDKFSCLGAETMTHASVIIRKQSFKEVKCQYLWHNCFYLSYFRNYFAYIRIQTFYSLDFFYKGHTWTNNDIPKKWES